MSLRRFGPLMAASLIALALLVVRLFQVQVVEHEVWAREAANLSRENEVLPYLRGEIRDRDGVVLAQDESVYRLEFAYRSFRREHALGQVAHALSDLHGHAVTLIDAAEVLENEAQRLVQLSPRDIDAFARGAALPSFGVPEANSARDERRRSRAASLRFYVGRLLDLDRVEWNDLKRAARKGDDRLSYFQLAQKHRRTESESLLEFRTRMSRARDDLQGLAGALDLAEFARQLHVAEPRDRDFTGLGGLLELLQERRESIEDDVAGDLFRAAAGFSVGVLPPDVLREWFDLGWIADMQGWEADRLDEWLEGPHRRWLSNQRSFHAPAALIQSNLETDGLSDGDALGRFLDEASRRYEPADLLRSERQRRLRDGPPPWWQLERCAVLDELPEILDAPWPEATSIPGMPFQDPEWRAARARGDVDSLDAFAAFGFMPDATATDWMPPGSNAKWTAPGNPAEWRERLVAAFGEERSKADTKEGRREREDRVLLPLAFQEAWLEVFQSIAIERLWEAGANAEVQGTELPFEFVDEAIERAADRRNYAVRDRGSRVVVVDGAPHIGVVQKISRFPERFAGFHVRDVPRRKSLIMWDDDMPLAEFQVGGVRHSTLTESVGQVELLRELRELQRTTGRDEILREAIAGLAREIYRADEQRGRSGAELLYDEELRGRNGYREREGLKERRRDPKKVFTKEPEHGRDLELTIDVALQRAAQDVILHPKLPPDIGVDRDDDWFASPVGAIVMITPDGEVLAAASAPREPQEALPGRSKQRENVIDRALRIPTGQPPGSIFKPLIAAHAIETRGLSPQQVFRCVDEDGTGAGYGGLHCHSSFGHGDVVLHDALQDSCNSYFAQVGELYLNREEFLELVHFYGLDEPTGINVGGRRGYYEDSRIQGLHRAPPNQELTLRHRLAGGNGLNPIEATPLQMARAFAGLATGELPELRMVRKVGGELVPKASRHLSLSAHTRRLIRDAMIDVCERGSAKKAALKRSDLGFAMAAKTGSADFLPMTSGVLESLQLIHPERPPSMRKHTWVAGWFPADDPQAIIVVFLHDVGVTSGKNAIFVAEQFMHRPEIDEFLAGGSR
jgi:cell division protein FtsI/penicillin-binding protein 2